MQNWQPTLIILAIILWVLGLQVWNKRKAEQHMAPFRAVNKDHKYANNHRVIEAGYYHATSGMWHERPWNEYREGQGYYWDGGWHAEPDQRQVASSTPQPGEVERVNALWFAADPERLRKYNEEVERSGFGDSTGRTSGS
jgi:hypothetical protein